MYVCVLRLMGCLVGKVIGGGEKEDRRRQKKKRELKF